MTFVLWRTMRRQQIMLLLLTDIKTATATGHFANTPSMVAVNIKHKLAAESNKRPDVLYY